MSPPPGADPSGAAAAVANLSVAPNPGDAEIAVEPDNSYEDDPSYDSELGSYTTSLSSSVANYRFENGRRYHSYREGSYIWPNDEAENDRLDMMHQLFTTARRGKIIHPTLKNPRRILDIGTGTGIWAMEIADMYPNASVLGNDLSPIQPKWVPPNLSFEIDDVEDQWTYAQPFDFIHCRLMHSSIRDWKKLVQQIYDNLAPGGYAEFLDFDCRWTSPDGTLKDDSTIAYVVKTYMQLLRSNGLHPTPGCMFEEWTREVGFSVEYAERFPVPCGTWPADKRLKEVGAWQYLELSEGLDGMVMALFTKGQGMSKDEVTALAARFKQEMKDPKVHAMLYFHVVSVRKPDITPAEDDS